MSNTTYMFLSILLSASFYTRNKKLVNFVLFVYNIIIVYDFVKRVYYNNFLSFCSNLLVLFNFCFFLLKLMQMHFCKNKHRLSVNIFALLTSTFMNNCSIFKFSNVMDIQYSTEKQYWCGICKLSRKYLTSAKNRIGALKRKCLL